MVERLVNVNLFATVHLEAADQGSSYNRPFIEKAGTRAHCYLHSRSETSSFCCGKDYSFALERFYFLNLPDYTQYCCVALSLSPTHAPSHT